MKKIMSIFVIMVMVLTLSTSVCFADDSIHVFVNNGVTNTEVDYVFPYH